MINLNYKEIEKKIEAAKSIIKEHTKLFGVETTDMQHTIGKLAELEAVRLLGGTLAKRKNQPGWDLITPDGRKCQVKGTSSKLYDSYMAINPNTKDMADDLMVMLYDGKSEQMEVLYHGPMDHVIDTVAYKPDGKSNNKFRLSKSNALKAKRTLIAKQTVSLDEW